MDDDKKGAVDEFLGDLKPSASEDVFEEPKGDIFGETASAEPKEEEPKEEEKLPFHKDPKIQRFIEKEISKRIPEQKQTEVEKFIKTEGADEIDEVLTRIIGNDSPEKLSAIKDFKKVLLDREERGAMKALEKIQAERQAELEAERKAEQTLLQGLDDIEDSYGVDITSNQPSAKKMRGEFINFVKRVAPKDSSGEIVEYPDLQETFKLYKQVNKAPSSNQKAKELASRSMERGGDATTVPVQEDKSWGAVDRIFSKLTG